MNIKRMAKILNALANENRIKILILSKNSTTSEKLLKELAFKTQSGLLKHLSILEDAGLIKKERGKSTITETGSLMMDLLESYDRKTEEYFIEQARGRLSEVMEGYGFTVSKEDLAKLLKKKK